MVMTKTEAQAKVDAFIIDLGYEPSEVQNINISDLPTIDLTLKTKDDATGQVTNRSERLSWVNIPNQLAMQAE